MFQWLHAYRTIIMGTHDQGAIHHSFRFAQPPSLRLSTWSPCMYIGSHSQVDRGCAIHPSSFRKQQKPTDPRKPTDMSIPKMDVRPRPDN
ncbi:hypothetical protein FRB94_006330 [Tulasnella sp. JGI-2019a]|nr:hypothetical protein FRB94_006330 [Tulasnella sp. JGI-2019a]